MITLDKLKELVDLCAGSVTLIHNEHRDYYQTVDKFLRDSEFHSGLGLGIDIDVREAMIEKNQMLTLQAYPDTPIGFYVVYHWDTESAIDQMLAIVKKTAGH